MDDAKTIFYRRDGQGARTYYRKKDGSFAVAVETSPNVIEFGRLVVVPDRTVLDAYEDAVGRGALRAALDAALAVFEATVDAAFELLREALGS